MSDIERALASVRRIDNIVPIEGADMIECAWIGGWNVVVKKGEFQIGALVAYYEIDSWIPNSLAPFLSGDKEPREYKGIKGERLRTKKLRGVFSQGLILPLPEGHQDAPEGTNLTEVMGIIKWEKELPAALSGFAKSTFPSWIPKTDEPRCLFSGTLIFTEFGEQSIQSIVEEKKPVNVFSVNHITGAVELNPVIDFIKSSKTSEWVKIKTKSGKTLKVTPNHKIWCNDISAYREAKDLIVGQKLLVQTDE